MAQGAAGRRHGAHGVPRGAARGLRDRRLPARRLQREPATRTRPAVGAVARHRRRGRARLRHLPRRRAAEPVEVLPRHRARAGAGRRRSGGHRAAHRARGRLAERRAAVDRRPQRRGAARLRAVGAAHRDARGPAASGVDRGRRMAGLPGADRAVRGLAAESDPGPRHAGADRDRGGCARRRRCDRAGLRRAVRSAHRHPGGHRDVPRRHRRRRRAGGRHRAAHRRRDSTTASPPTSTPPRTPAPPPADRHR